MLPLGHAPSNVEGPEELTPTNFIEWRVLQNHLTKSSAISATVKCELNIETMKWTMNTGCRQTVPGCFYCPVSRPCCSSSSSCWSAGRRNAHLRAFNCANTNLSPVAEITRGTHSWLCWGAGNGQTQAPGKPLQDIRVLPRSCDTGSFSLERLPQQTWLWWRGGGGGRRRARRKAPSLD